MNDFLKNCEAAARAGGQVLLDWIGHFDTREKGRRLVDGLAGSALLGADGWLAVEHAVDETPADDPRLARVVCRRHGGTAVVAFPASGGACMTRTAVYPGSFDPITNGHVDIIARSLQVFDRVIVAVAYNIHKDAAMFTPDERVAMIAAVFRRYGEPGDRGRIHRAPRRLRRAHAGRASSCAACVPWPTSSTSSR